MCKWLKKRKIKNSTSANLPLAEEMEDIDEKCEKLKCLKPESLTFIYNRTMAEYQLSLDLANSLKGSIRFRLSILGVILTLGITILCALIGMGGIVLNETTVLLYALIAALFISNLGIQYPICVVSNYFSEQYSTVLQLYHQELFTSNIGLDMEKLQMKDIIFSDYKTKVLKHLINDVSKKLDDTSAHIYVFAVFSICSSIVFLFLNTIPYELGLVLVIILLIIPLVIHSCFIKWKRNKVEIVHAESV